MKKIYLIFILDGPLEFRMLTEPPKVKVGSSWQCLIDKVKGENEKLEPKEQSKRSGWKKFLSK